MFHHRVLTMLTAAVLALGPATAAPAAAVPGVPGFDISGATPHVDWAGVKAAGARFVFITATEGTSRQYPNFGQLSGGAAAAGLVRGAVHVGIPNISGGAAQADFFVAHGGAWSADHQTLPGGLDIEYNPYGAACYGLSQSAMAGWITGFAGEYHARTGRRPIIYTTTSWWNTCVGTGGRWADDPLWIAGWNDAPSPLPGGWSTYTFWQYASEGTFPGGQDVFNGTPAGLVALADGA
jgi:GH25 family lysozyme M1 (1,4-beta-N-acetylmuramidase)